MNSIINFRGRERKMALASSSSATVAVEKATSDLLIGPDWTMNIDICDSVNSNHWLVKDVVKALKKRLHHKNPKVQLLAFTLLETMVKNCGDYIHFQIAEKNILGEMVKIVKKKTDMHVRNKVLVLLDSWQEAFGGPGGKHPQYYWAYEELRRSGVEFPQRSLDAAPIFTPPVSHSTLRPPQAGYGMPSNSSRRLDETMATEIEGLSLSTLESMRNVMELLSDMLQAVNPDDREAVKDEVIVDLVNHCRSNQKKLMQMLTTTGDEELLGQGLELNDSLQVLLAKHDAIASGSPIPTQTTYLEPKPSSNSKSAEVKDSISSSSTNTSMPVANVTRSYIDEEDEEEDDFAQLARRHSKTKSSPSQSSQALVPVDTITATSTATASTPAVCNALALVDQPAPLSTMKEQEIIDLLSITLSTSSTSHQPHTSCAPLNANQSIPPAPASSTQGYPYVSQTYPGNQGQGQEAYNTYVVPWAQPQSQMPSHSHTQPQSQQHQQEFQHQPHPQSHTLHQPQQQFPTQSHSQTQQFQTEAQPQLHAQPPSQQQFQPQYQPHTEAQLQSQPQSQQHSGPQLQPQLQTQPQQFQQQPQQQLRPRFQQQSQPQYPQYTSGYVPPPWAATPGYASGQRQSANSIYSYTEANPNSSYASAQAARPMHNSNSLNSRGTNGSSMSGEHRLSSVPSGQKNFVPSYRLFEDLNVFGNTDGRFNMTGNASPSLSGPSSQGMVGGRK
ncbi:TOM1-like protein 6 isoform X2 [Euphorbia lathyris]|uniref:TOM1-like protein 6 isoform X2 n=1 Tax=Euphorbia lathyris TaxID=212925 RepID=UPI0033130E94